MLRIPGERTGMTMTVEALEWVWGKTPTSNMCSLSKLFKHVFKNRYIYSLTFLVVFLEDYLCNSSQKDGNFSKTRVILCLHFSLNIVPFV